MPNWRKVSRLEISRMMKELTAELAHLLKGDEDFDPDGYGDGAVVATEDGCHVEPDGTCPHGFESPLRRLGMC